MLKPRQQDYFVARWEENGLIMEPFYHCRNMLEEDYFCKDGARELFCLARKSLQGI
jgi:hypothetical protein